MESWLEENCERGVGLKGMISRMEGAVREKRRKEVKEKKKREEECNGDEEEAEMINI